MHPAEFHVLALSEIDAVHRLAYHLCRDQNEADDLVQETYLRALRAVDTFRPGEHGVRPWLFKILHNALHTRRSQDRRRREVLRTFGNEPRKSTEEYGAAAGSPTPVNGRTAVVAVTAAVDWDGLDERLCRAIRLLPVAHRTVFLLSAVEDLKYREIADVVNVPVGTVMSRLSRARSALAAQLGGLAAERNLRRGRRGTGAPQPIPSAEASR